MTNFENRECTIEFLVTKLVFSDESIVITRSRSLIKLRAEVSKNGIFPLGRSFDFQLGNSM